MSNEIEKQKDRHLNDIDGRVSDRDTWENLSQYLLFLRHKKAYLYAFPFCQGKNVLDYGCGNGYGSFLLAELSLHVTAVDINGDIIRACQQKYQHRNLSFQLVEPGKRTHLKNSSFDVAVSLQVIEHVRDVPGYLNELKRILKEDGVLIIATPNRKHRLYPFQPPSNRFHLREYSLRRLRKQLKSHFKHVTILGINGNKEINTIEYKRVNKSLLKNYVPYRLKSWVKYNLFKIFGEKNTAASDKKPLHIVDKSILNQYSIDDFFILEEDVEKGLDFLAILRNN